MEKNLKSSGEVSLILNDLTTITFYTKNFYKEEVDIRTRGFVNDIGSEVIIYPYHSIKRIEFKPDPIEIQIKLAVEHLLN